MAKIYSSDGSYDSNDFYKGSKAELNAKARNNERDRILRQSQNDSVLPSERYQNDDAHMQGKQKSTLTQIYENGMKSYQQQKQDEFVADDLARNPMKAMSIADANRRDALRSKTTFTISGGLTQMISENR